MFILSAFADEISPDPVEQVKLLAASGVRHIELRSILNTNVLDLTDLQIEELRTLFERHQFQLSAIGSPIGKIKIDQPFAPHLARFERAIELCKVFNTSNIRIFSYYKPDGTTWEHWRPEVLRRMEEKLARAEKAGVRLLHENEHNIYGDDPLRVRDLLDHLQGKSFGAVYDAANYVYGGFDPWQGWELTRDRTVHLHIKDWKTGESQGSLAGEGDGQWPRVLADAVAGGYHGFATLEPHLMGGGPTGGKTGPELFPKAIQAFTRLLDQVGGQYS
jgi:sugar phosphate isomerase/epimerase